ncbi:MAG: Crp/Fnr family transcriptional regulator [Hyphomicrobiaceae bacterium]|nr:Crp/Fnr family transcriptional regulator [Hyphomicrobiaceae bacterium]
MSAKDELRQIAFWGEGLSEEEAARALKAITRRSYPAGSYICHRGDRIDHWTGVIHGLVQLGAVSAEGKAITIAGVRSGGWFGEGTVIKGEARKYDMLALRDTTLAMMARPTFMWLLETSVGFNRFLVHQLNERIGQFIAMVEYDRLHNATARVARHIAWLFNPVLYPNGGDRIEMTQEEVGLLAGVSRQVANKSLTRLESLGLIRTERGCLQVLDVGRLAQFDG